MDKLSSDDRATVKEALKELIAQEESGTAEVCTGLLTAVKNHPELEAEVAETVASFAKEAEFRDVALSHDLVPALCGLLASDDKPTQLQTLRAIGNLCYEHDGNRELVLSSGGCPLLVNQLTSCTLLPAAREYDRLKCVSCGCLLNVSNDNEKLSAEMLGLKVVQPLSTLLANPGEDPATISMGLQALHVLLVAGAAKPDLVPPSSLAPTFSRLLHRCIDGDLSEETCSLLETVEVAIVANEEVKVGLVEAGCVENLVKMTEPSLQMKAIDILILISANDASLKLMGEKPALLTAVLQWLAEPSSLKRQANTALLCANMARTDEMCDLFISRGVVSLLIHLTQLEEPEELSGKVHVSALSALRNLCLPDQHKPLLLEKGVLKTALSCLKDSEWPHVHFKSLGIARLLAIQQEEVCKELVLTEPGTVGLVCERCSKAEPPHVTIEGSRLLAAVVKHCKSEDVMRMVVSEGGVKLISSLLQSEHVSMQNESLIALNLLAVLKEGGESVEASLTDEEAVLSGVWGVVSNTNSSPELLTNALTFLLQLATSHPQAKDVLEKMRAFEGFTERMQVLSQHSSDAIRDKAHQISVKVSVDRT